MLHILRNLPATLLIASGVGYALALAQTTGLVTPALCISPSSLVIASPSALWEALRIAFAFNAPLALALSWIAMMLAMMPLLIGEPLAHVWHRSLRRRQTRAVALFVVGYAAVWLVAGLALTTIAIAAGVFQAMSATPFAAALAAVPFAVWTATPFKQHCINRCHRRPSLRAFGLSAENDVLRYGVTHGAWCVGACWPLMLLPLFAGAWHLPVMVAVSLWLLDERYRSPLPSRWGFGTPALGAPLAAMTG